MGTTRSSPCLALPPIHHCSLALLFFSEDRKSFLFLALLVSIDHSLSISRHRPRKPSQKFNMCDFVASSQAFVTKAGIACDHWCPYIARHRELLRVLLTHVWKPGFKQLSLEIFIYRVINNKHSIQHKPGKLQLNQRTTISISRSSKFTHLQTAGTCAPNKRRR